jgi:hypothetical protein
MMAAAVLGVGAAMLPAGPVSAATNDSIYTQRATVRENPGRLVLANAMHGDQVEVTAHCGAWVRVRVTARHAMATPVGWVLRDDLTKARRKGGLDGVPERCGTDGDRWKDWVGAINAPFHSLRKVNGTWRRITFGTGVSLAARPECGISLNYTRRDNAPDQIDPSQRVTGLDLTNVSYRYVTTDGSVALVSAPRVGASYGVWGFVPAGCVVPKGRPTVYFNEPVVQLRNIANLAVGAGYPDSVIKARGCSAAVRSTTHPNFGYVPDPAHKPACPV